MFRLYSKILQLLFNHICGRKLFRPYKKTSYCKSQLVNYGNWFRFNTVNNSLIPKQWFTAFMLSVVKVG